MTLTLREPNRALTLTLLLNQMLPTQVVPISSSTSSVFTAQLGVKDKAPALRPFRGVHGNENRKIDCLRAVCDIKSIHDSHCTLPLRGKARFRGPEN